MARCSLNALFSIPSVIHEYRILQVETNKCFYAEKLTRLKENTFFPQRITNSIALLSVRVIRLRALASSKTSH